MNLTESQMRLMNCQQESMSTRNLNTAANSPKKTTTTQEIYKTQEDKRMEVAETE